MARVCPICGSDKTGGYPKQHKQYTERGRLDIDDWHCHTCKASWEIWDYVREGMTENKEIRRGDGNRLEWGVMANRICKGCQSRDVTYIQHDGRWHVPDTEILRYECNGCGEVWQEMAQISDGTRLFRRVWRGGRTSDK